MPTLTFNDIPGAGDIKVLNYALALEALEADLYVQALMRLTTGGVNSQGTNIPGLGLSDSEPDVRYTTTFGTVERQHRDFLNGSLADASIIGAGSSGILRTAKFDFGIQSLSRQQVLELLYTVESTGVMAYLGALKYFTTRNYVGVAGGIQGTEARHTAVLAIVFNLLGFTPRKNTAPLAGQSTSILGVSNTSGIDGTLEPDTVLMTVSPWIIV
ncbi:MAG: ferritin-like domain-containing protein [Armatimonas sp.]